MLTHVEDKFRKMFEEHQQFRTFMLKRMNGYLDAVLQYEWEDIEDIFETFDDGVFAWVRMCDGDEMFCRFPPMLFCVPYDGLREYFEHERQAMKNGAVE